MTYVKYKIADNAYGILAQDVEIDDTTITLSEQHNLPSDNAILTLVQKDSNGEIIKSEKVLLTSRNNLVLTVQRWYDGSIAKEFNTGDYVYLFVVSKVVKDIQDEVERLWSVKADDSDVVHKSGNETISWTKTFKWDTPLRFKEASANAYTGFQFQKSDGTIVWEMKKWDSDFIYISHWNKTFYLWKDSWVGIWSIPAGNLANTHSLAIWDSDTWFKRNWDWNLSWYANNSEVFNWTSNLFKFFKNIQYSNEATLSLWYGLNWQLWWSWSNSYKFKNHNWNRVFEIYDNWTWRLKGDWVNTDFYLEWKWSYSIYSALNSWDFWIRNWQNSYTEMIFYEQGHKAYWSKATTYDNHTFFAKANSWIWELRVNNEVSGWLWGIRRNDNVNWKQAMRLWNNRIWVDSNWKLRISWSFPWSDEAWTIVWTQS